MRQNIRDAAAVDKNTEMPAKTIPSLVLSVRNIPRTESQTIGKILYPKMLATLVMVTKFSVLFDGVAMSLMRIHMTTTVMSESP